MDLDDDVSEWSDGIAGLYYPTHEAFRPTRRFTDLRDDYALYAVYDEVEETDVQAAVIDDVRAVETAGGMPLLVHVVDPVTALHSFYIYARHDDPAMMAAWDAEAGCAWPEMPVAPA